jgi:hypothetical protein
MDEAEAVVAAVVDLAATQHDNLPPSWEAVVDEHGRTYFWNVDTDEVSWERPVQVKAKSSVASGEPAPNKQTQKHSTLQVTHHVHALPLAQLT